MLSVVYLSRKGKAWLKTIEKDVNEEENVCIHQVL